MVTNQSGVARGFFAEAVVDRVHRHIADLLAAGRRPPRRVLLLSAPSGRTSAPSSRGACDCRKPGRGTGRSRRREFGDRSGRSFTVGDRWLDVALARTVGARGVLVRTGYGADEERRAPDGLAADAVVNNLVEAASWILATLESPDAETAGIHARQSLDAQRPRTTAPLLSLVERLRRPPRARRRRPDRRRVHLRRGAPRVARGAGPDPEVRRDGDRAPGGAGNAASNVAALGGRARARRHGRRRRRGAAAARELSARRRPPRGRARAQLPDAGQDAHSGRRHALGEAAGRADRSRDRLAAGRRRSAAAFARQAGAALGDCDAVLLSDYGSGLVTPALAAARAARARGATRRRADARPRRQPLPAARLPRADRLHAERVRSRAAARHPHRRRPGRARARRPRRCCRRTGMQARAHHARQPRHGALRAAGSRRFTFRSSDPTKWPTSPAPATR